MSVCEDPLLTYLVGLGYNTVRLPSTKIQPLDLLGYEDGWARNVEWLGPLPTACISKVAPPTMRSETATSLNVVSTSAIKIGVAATVLHNVLSAFGVDGARLLSSHASVRYLRFTFEQPTIQVVEPVALGKWLARARPDKKNPVVKRYFEGAASGEGQLGAYVITETLTSNSITVGALNAAHEHVEVDLPKVQQLVDGHVEVSQSARGSGELHYKGKHHLTFGFKAQELERSFDEWALKNILPGEAPLGTEEEKDPAGSPASPPRVFSDGWIDLETNGHARRVNERGPLRGT